MLLLEAIHGHETRSCKHCEVRLTYNRWYEVLTSLWTHRCSELALLKLTKVTLFTTVLYNSENSIHDKAILSSTALSQGCCEVYFISLAAAKLLWDLTTQYCWNRPLTLLAGSAPAVTPFFCRFVIKSCVKYIFPRVHIILFCYNHMKYHAARVTNLFETESYFLVQIHAKGYQFDTHTSEIKIAKFVFNFVIIHKNKDIHPCENTDHVYAIVRTSPQATNDVRAGDLVPAGTILVTPAIRQWFPNFFEPLPKSR